MVPLPRSVATLVAKLGGETCTKTPMTDAWDERYSYLHELFFFFFYGKYRCIYIHICIYIYIYVYIYFCTIHGSFGFVQFFFVQEAVQRKVVGCFCLLIMFDGASVYILFDGGIKRVWQHRLDGDTSTTFCEGIKSGNSWHFQVMFSSKTCTLPEN